MEATLFYSATHDLKVFMRTVRNGIREEMMEATRLNGEMSFTISKAHTGKNDVRSVWEANIFETALIQMLDAEKNSWNMNANPVITYVYRIAEDDEDINLYILTISWSTDLTFMDNSDTESESEED